MKKWETEILLKFLDILGEKFSNAGCNDVMQDMADLIPPGEKIEIDRKFHEWNGDMENHDPDNPFIHKNDTTLMCYITARIEDELKDKQNEMD